MAGKYNFITVPEKELLHILGGKNNKLEGTYSKFMVFGNSMMPA